MSIYNEKTKHRFVLGDILGEGGFGTVHSATNTDTGEIVAIKKINKSKIRHPTPRKHMVNEIRLLEHFFKDPENCKLFLCYKEFFEDKDNVYIVTENLSPSYVTLKPKNMYELKQRAPKLFHKILINMAKAVKALHQMNLVHMDIKPSNFMVNVENGQVKLIDFGLSCRIVTILDASGVAECTERSKQLYGTLGYIDPEFFDLHNERDYPKNDVFALGATFYAFATGEKYILGNTSKEQEHNNRENKHRAIPDNEYTDLLHGMLRPTPYDRIDIDMVLDMLRSI